VALSIAEKGGIYSADKTNKGHGRILQGSGMDVTEKIHRIKHAEIKKAKSKGQNRIKGSA
jgi:hypothetical protein